MHIPAKSPIGLALLDPDHPLREELLPPSALAFLADLTRRSGPELRALLRARQELQARLDTGERLGFLPETAAIRAGDWRVAPLPSDLLDRRVEITGPPEPKMAVNALNSGASCYMADFEDSCAPVFDTLLEGQRTLREAVRRTLAVDDPATGKAYRLGDRTAVLHARPRGLHLEERHVLVDGEPLPAAIFDAGLFLFHNAAELLARGSGPYLYLPKLEHHLEARWWDALLRQAEALLDLPAGSIRTTVLIETLPAAFQMDEILFALKDRAAGLNCGRWDYIFSAIKKRRLDPAALLPDRATVTMDQPFLQAYARLLIQTCHRRGVHAMGGMAAQIPIKGDPAANEAALAKVREDKEREVREGHDGTWVAHPALVPVAKAVFDAHLDGPNQLHRLREEVRVTAEDLLAVPQGAITLAGVRRNARVALRYLAAWLEGRGCVPIDHLMEDAATAEIARAQLWQWQRHRAPLAEGGTVDADLLRAAFDAEQALLRQELGVEAFQAGAAPAARKLLEALTTSEVLEDFLTVPAYGHLVANELMARVG
ncbi:MAG TPA: malate synthase A [Holophagaceae bacterium]|nr:malate synthase A [Holophagaceae bacterium]